MFFHDQKWVLFFLNGAAWRMAYKYLALPHTEVQTTINRTAALHISRASSV